MAILITGGAGYIGSHTARALHEQGEEIVVFDSLQTGHRQAVPEGVPFYQGDLREAGALEPVFENHSISAVVHFAAFSLVGESVTEPLKYYNNNVHGTECLLTALRDHGVFPGDVLRTLADHPVETAAALALDCSREM